MVTSVKGPISMVTSFENNAGSVQFTDIFCDTLDNLTEYLLKGISIATSFMTAAGSILSTYIFCDILDSLTECFMRVGFTASCKMHLTHLHGQTVGRYEEKCPLRHRQLHCSATVISYIAHYWSDRRTYLLISDYQIWMRVGNSVLRKA
jgi:hypothetical protein